MLYTGVDESDECVVAYPADEISGVEVTVGDINEDYFVKYPIVEFPGVDIKLGDAQLTGVNKDFDAKPTGVELEVATNSYGKAYEAVQEQVNKIEVYGLRQKGPTEGMVFFENNVKKYKIQV